MNERRHGSIRCGLSALWEPLCPRRERALGGVGPQASGGHEVVGEGVPERMGLRLDQTANGEKTEAMVLAVGVDPLDALAQSIDSLARLARHPFPPRSEAGGLLLHSDINEAITSEKRIKKWERRWKLELIESFNPEWADLYDALNG